MDKNMADDKKKKKKMNYTPLILVMMVVIGTVSMFMMFFSNTGENNKAEKTASNSSVQGTQENMYSIKINMESCSARVGESFYVSAAILPYSSEVDITWKSSNEKIFTVDENGLVSVVGEGNAELTAKADKVSSSIEIEGVAEGNEPVLGFPWHLAYGVAEGGGELSTKETADGGIPLSEQDITQAAEPESIPGNTQNPGGNENSTMTEQNGNGTVPGANGGVTVPSQSNQETVPGQSGTGNNQTPTQAPTTAPTQGNNTQKPPVQPPTQPQTEAPSIENKVVSTELHEALIDAGYTHYLEDTYVYQQNETYYGEIIISSEATHIYIKERTGSFDTAIKDVLMELLPNSYQSVWNDFTKAVSDSTMTLDGRTVRIVVPANGGHSQIVIYN